MNKVGYAYLDKYGILKVNTETTAKEFAKYNGKIVETTYPHGNRSASLFDVPDTDDDVLKVDWTDKSFKVGKKEIGEAEFKKRYADVYNLLMQLI